MLHRLLLAVPALDTLAKNKYDTFIVGGEMT
jgi:hypothetical protein